MTRTTITTSLIAAALLAATPAFAGQWEGNPDLQDSILNDLDKPAFVGTSMPMARQRIDVYHGAFAGSADIDHSGYSVANGSPETGQGDQYGWVVIDVGGWH